MRLKDITTLSPQYRGKDLSGNVSFVPMEALRYDCIDAQEIPFSEGKGKYTFFADGDLLIAKVTPCFENGNIAIASGLKEGIGFGSSEIFVLRPGKEISSKYLFYISQASPFKDGACATMCGVGGLKRISPLFMRTFETELPSLDEQDRIVAYLDEKCAEIDNNVSVLNQKKEKYELLKKSLIQHAVTKGLNPDVEMKESGVEWIGRIPKHWEIRRMKDLFIERGQLSTTGAEDLLSVSEYYGVARRADKLESDDEYISRADSLIGYKRCYAGDLVINIMLAWKTGLGISDYDGIVSPAYAVYKGVNLCPHFFHYLLRTGMYTQQFKRHSKGIIDSRLRMYTDRFNTISAVYPPVEEQIEIAAYLDEKCTSIDNITNVIEQQIDKYTQLKKSLINEVITGQRAV